MKIKDLRTYLLYEPFPNVLYSGRGRVAGRDVLIVEIETDEGIMGHSFITGLQVAFGAEIKVLELIINQGLKGFIIDADPFMTEEIWRNMYRGTVRFGRRGAAIRALSAVDMALWDIKGKYAGLPLWRMLGGYRNSIVAYASGGHYTADKTIEDLAEEMRQYVLKGFQAVKMRVGRASLNEDTERVRAVREAIGENVRLMVDAGENWDVSTAVMAGRKWEEFNLLFIEEPVPTDDIEGLRMIRSKIATPIALGENEYTRFGFRDLIAANAVDIIQPDVTRVGGITEWMKIAHLASAFGLKVAPHGVQEIHLQLALAIENCTMIEYAEPEHYLQTLIDRIFDEPKESKHIDSKGMLKTTEQPGLGLKINWDVVKDFLVS
jgi:L-alanine-DL-glutamate epimerase-like enolase superfamily enzyme